MKYSKLWIPTFLMAAFGGCLGFLFSAIYSDWCWGGLVCRSDVAAYCPLWLLGAGGSLSAFLASVHALLGVLAASLSLWAWSEFGGREFLAAWRQGAARPEARSLLCRMGLWAGTTAGLAGLWESASLHPYRVAHPLLQALGVLTFVPALWALGQHRRLLHLLRQPSQALKASDFRLLTALVSPLITAPAASALIPASSLQETLYSAARLTSSLVALGYPGPWPVALWMGSLFAGLGLVLGMVRRHRLASLALLWGLGHLWMGWLTSMPERLPAQTPSLSSYQLVPLDPQVTPLTVARRMDPNVQGLSPYRQMVRAQAAAGQQLLDWRPDQALTTLAGTPRAWFKLSYGLLPYFENLRPADRDQLLESQLSLAESGAWLHDGRLDPGSAFPEVQRLRKLSVTARPASLRGRLELDGQPLARVRLRLERYTSSQETPQDALRGHLRAELSLGRLPRAGWLLVPVLRSFYAQVVSDDSGGFELSGLEPGTYELVLRYEGSSGVRVLQAPGAFHLDEGQSLTLEPVLLTR